MEGEVIELKEDLLKILKILLSNISFDQILSSYNYSLTFITFSSQL